MSANQTSSNGELFSDLHDEFLAEAREHVERVEELLLILEKRGSGRESADDAHATESAEAVAEVFRAIHSIKGAAAFMGFANISDLSHAMETVLHKMRSGDIPPAAGPVMDALLAGLDALGGLLDDLDSEGDVDIAPVQDRLSAIIHETSSDEAKTEMNTQIRVADADGQGFAVNQFSLNKVLQAHDHLYFLQFDLNELQAKSGVTPVTLVRRLLDHGEMVDTRIETQAAALKEDLSAAPLIYRVLYATDMKPDAMEAEISLDHDRIIPIDRSTLAPSSVETQKDSYREYVAQETLECPPDKSSTTDGLIRSSASPSNLHGCAETIRVKVDILDRLMELAGELVLVRNQHKIAVGEDTSVSRSISQRLDIVTTELQETVMRTRMQPLGNIFARLPRIVRDLSLKLEKDIDISMSGSEVELDKSILEALADPLIHLIRNCCDHGIETPAMRQADGKPRQGKIQVSAYHEAGQINLCVKDDGRGVDLEALKRIALARSIKTKSELSRMSDKEILSLILLPGFSTTDTVSSVSGRGVGMDVVKSAMDGLGGTIDIDSEFGKGLVIHLRLPLTLAIIPCLIVCSGEHHFAIPQVNLVELVCLYDDEVFSRIEQADDQEVFRLRNQLLPMARLDEVLKRPQQFSRDVKREIAEAHRRPAKGSLVPESLHFAVVKFGARRLGLIVDAVLGTEEIVVKPMHSAMKYLGIYSGATVMGDGRVALILDVEGVARHAGAFFNKFRETTEESYRQDDTQTVLLFASGDQEQFAVTLPLIRRIEKIDLSCIEKIGDKSYILAFANFFHPV